MKRERDSHSEEQRNREIAEALRRTAEAHGHTGPKGAMDQAESLALKAERAAQDQGVERIEKRTEGRVDRRTLELAKLGIERFKEAAVKDGVIEDAAALSTLIDSKLEQSDSRFSVKKAEKPLGLLCWHR